MDAVGNLHAVRRGARPGPTVLIAAHTDEIGLIVKAVEPDGFLRFDTVGGVLDHLLAARLVRVGGFLGVIGMRAGHFQSAEERGRVPSPATMYIDIGARSAAEVAPLGIGVGDPIAFKSDLVAFGPDAAMVAGKRWRPDLAIAADTMSSGDTPDMSLTRDLNVRLGLGPVLQVLAGQAGRGFLVHPAVARFLRGLADAEGVPLQDGV